MISMSSSVDAMKINALECRLAAGRHAGASLCPRMVCTACGLIGADVRPDWSPHTNARPS
jgi:hypothetical protein